MYLQSLNIFIHFHLLVLTYRVLVTNCFYPQPNVPFYFYKTRRGRRGGLHKQKQVNKITTLIGRRPNVTCYPSRPPSTLLEVPVITTQYSCKHDFNSDNSNDFKVLLLNSQSTRNKSNSLNDLIQESNVEIAFFTESWLSPGGDETIIADITPSGYKNFSVSRQNGRGGGIFIVYKKSLNVEINNQYNYKTFECCQLKLTTKERSCSFVCIYRPPPSKKNKFTTKEFTTEFNNLLDQLSPKGTMPIILGDFNLHYDNPSNADVKRITSLLTTHCLEQVIDKPTHNKKHILDWVITNSQNKINNVNVFDKCLSDHYVITFTINVAQPSPIKRTIVTRETDIDHDQLRTDITQSFLNIQNCSVETYNSKLSELLEHHAPTRSRTVTDRPSAPWMDGDIKKAKAERRRAERQWRASGLSVHRDIYRNFNNKVRLLITNAKHSYYNRQIDECTTTRALFCVTNSISGKKTACDFPKNIAQKDMPDVFGRYFKNKVSDIRQKLDTNSPNPPHFKPFNGDKPFCEFSPVTEDEVRAIIQSSPPKTCCLDPIPTPLLLKLVDTLIPVITGIINASLQSGIVPHPFKHAVVTPILKKANLSPEDLKNFRPVSGLPFLSKILEKIVATQLKSHLFKYDLYERNQSAYRQFHNTETALLKIQNDLLCEADGGNISVLALLDLSAAFDTIDHSILVERLFRSFGLSGTVLKWFESYLIGRTQSVQVKGLQSSSFSLDFGVPQGSVLGPILYTLYTQPLGAVIKQHNVKYHMYADDTQLYSSVKPDNVAALMTSMECCIEDVKNWMVANKLKMNDDKTEVLFCNPMKDKISVHENSICINDVKIKFSQKARNLGLFFSNNLSMEHHVAHLCKLIYCEIRRIGQLSAFLNETSLKILISSFVFTRLDYCNSLLSNSPEFLLDKLQRFQNQAARLVLRKSKREHITPMLLRLHWLPIRARVIYKVGVLCYKCINGNAPPYLSDLIELYVPSRSLRSGDHRLLRVPKKGSKKFSERSFVHFAPSVWNDLPLSLRQMSSEPTFKKHLKTHLFGKFLLN